jgi:hypothetical protein
MTRRMRIAALATGVAAVTIVLAIETGLVAGRDDGGPKAPIPRVCWYSDYDKGGLSNKCEYREGERRWYIEAEGEMVPADTQRMPIANLCLYFHGTKCPDRNYRRKGGDTR